MKKIIGSGKLKSINQILKENAQKYKDLPALVDEYSGYCVTYDKLYEDITKIATALQKIGISKGDKVSQFSENSSKWMVTDRALAANGAINAVRGSLAPVDELKYIYNHSDSIALVTDSMKLIDNMSDYIASKGSKFILYIGNEAVEKAKYNVPVFTFEEMLELGTSGEFTEPEIAGDDVMTFIYSSGTTGKPKGIMLTFDNIASQIPAIDPSLRLTPKATIITVLPIWHAYERTCEYYMLEKGLKICYTNIKNFKKDILKYEPHYFVAVPRLFEAVYDGIFAQLKKKTATQRKIFEYFLNKSKSYRNAEALLNNTDITNQHPTIMQKLGAHATKAITTPFNAAADKFLFSQIRNALGKNFVKGISGGGAMARHIDEFFRAVGIDVYVGYGLTETSPVVAVRQIGNNKVCATGHALANTKILVVDPETLRPVKKGTKGVVLIRGPQVMKGYYKDEEATKKVLLGNGFFNTGDIGWMTDDDCLVLTGRMKDIIVLSNGENIEPDAIEQSCMSSPYVKQIVVVGQDKNALGAIVVPELDALKELAAKHGIKCENLLQSQEIKNLVLKELRERETGRRSYRPHERLSNIYFEENAFTPENGMMTQTAKIKKNVVFDRYQKQIDEMFV